MIHVRTYYGAFVKLLYTYVKLLRRDIIMMGGASNDARNDGRRSKTRERTEIKELNVHGWIYESFDHQDVISTKPTDDAPLE